MKPQTLLPLTLFVAGVSVTLAACGDRFVDCNLTLTCPIEGSGGGDGTGGTGGGDGDGDGSGGNGTVTCGGTECSGDAPICDEDAEKCVECLETEHCDEGICDTDSNECVECLENTQCAAADASLCDAGECSPCTEHADCEHLSGTPLCDAEVGTCVECLPSEDDRESDSDACGTGVCNPETFTCDSTRTQATKGNCTACIADAECTMERNCIPLQYTGGAEPVEVGNFCMKIAPGCSPPYSAGAINRASVSGAAATNYCGLAEEFTTCAAIKDLADGKLCTNDNECGSEQGEGRCEIVNFDIDTKCTYSCTSSNQCVAGNTCNGLDDQMYCGGAL